jgi:hypothetical protein
MSFVYELLLPDRNACCVGAAIQNFDETNKECNSLYEILCTVCKHVWVGHSMFRT